MQPSELKPNHIVRGSILPEPVKIIALVPMGDSIKLIGEGMHSGKVHQPVLTAEQIAELEISPETEPFDGDAAKFRLGVEAMRLGLAYEYDPYFSLSIARVDPLPHQLEAVYDYFMKLPRIRFLLADDPGAGKTIMAGLLIKELKVRGVIKRILIVTPANLSFQWQRELKDKFRESFQIIRSDILRANYGANPWQDIDQCITSVSWISRVEDAKESLLRSHWDLVIVDEAHKMSAYSEDKKTLAYQLGETLSEMTDHYLLMTATPHKGDPKNFSLFLRLLDRDIYGDIKSLEHAMKERTAPFYLRRVKEAMVTFPDPDTGEAKSLFTKRNVHTAGFQIDNDELDFYDNLTRYVEDQSIKASQDDSARGRALGFTMAMLQRRFASSMYAVRRTLERMKVRREKILNDPEAYRQEQILKKVPDDFEELPEEEKQEILAKLEDVVASIDPQDLRDEILELGKLAEQARSLEEREIETKLNKLKDVITEDGIFQDEKMKLLIFTEHKDTLDYLAGDGRDGRPLGKLREWGLNITQIHGSMKIGDRDTPGTRIYAEREFREDCQVLVATEAAGEGINLQFCWYMINYDIPWNPNRLEQRMGRIHRYGQEKDCLISNFVSTNTREGRVLEKLFERIRKIENDLDPDRTGMVFNVLGDIFPANELERMLRKMYARNLTEAVIKDRIVKEVDTERLKRITESTLEGLAKRELNLSAIVGKSEEAKERRLVPEVVEDFFIQASPLAGISPKQERQQPRVYRLGRLPRIILPYAERLEPKFGKLGREYKQITFDKELLKVDATLEWVTPGHPLFESVRAMVEDKVQEDLQRGAVFYDLHRSAPALLNVFSGEIRDGRGHLLHKRLFVTHTTQDGAITVRQPTIFLDLSLAPKGTKVPDGVDLPGKEQAETVLYQKALMPLLEEECLQRQKEVKTISEHLEISLNAIIDRVQIQMGGLLNQKESGSHEAGLDGRIKMLEDRLDELNNRLEQRRSELEQEQQCTISNIQHLGSAWVLPHPDRETPEVKKMVSDPEIERTAVDTVIKHEESRGWRVESVEDENRGFDLISRKPHPEDPDTAIEVRFIEVKGRSHVGEVALSTNEYKTAKRLKKDYWLYVVFNCATNPEVHVIQDPGRMGWKPIVKVEHYHVGANEILKSEIKNARYCKRLIEVDLPIKRISAHSRREKSIRHGHISTLHIWWARRPLAACRAVICASLWPDPADDLCPDMFRRVAREQMKKWAKNHLNLLSEESWARFVAISKDERKLDDLVELRAALLDFIADFSNWDNSTVPEYLETSRLLTQVAHEALGGAPGTKPLVVDPFAGGGAIPVEALRVGANAFASDLNPVAVLLNRVVLKYIPKYGQKLANEVSKLGQWVREQAEKEIRQFYPNDPDGSSPIAYIWARTILSEAPDPHSSPVEIPLISSMWLSRKPHRGRALRWIRDSKGDVLVRELERVYSNGSRLRVRQPLLEVFQPVDSSEVHTGTVARGSATCPVSGFTVPVSGVRAQLNLRRGGAHDSRLICVVTTRAGKRGRFYRIPSSIKSKFF